MRLSISAKGANALSDIHVESLNIDGDSQTFVCDRSELSLVCRGSATLSIDDTEYAVRTSNLFILNANTAYRFTRAKNLAVYRIRFDCDSVFSQFPDVGELISFRTLFMLLPAFCVKRFFNNPGYRLKPTALEYVRSLVHGMLQESEHRSSGYESAVKCLFVNLVIFLCREFSNANIPGENNLYEISRSMDFIESHFTSAITLGDLSHASSLSKRHFDRVFKRVYNISPFEYINKLRLNRSYDRIKISKCSISEIAAECGFTDSNYFSRRFKKEFGVSPRQLKASCRNRGTAGAGSKGP